MKSQTVRINLIGKRGTKAAIGFETFGAPGRGAMRKEDPDRQKKVGHGRNPTPTSIAAFTKQFSVMIDAGLPLIQCLDMLGRHQANRRFKAAIFEVMHEVESGNSLAASMKMHPEIWDEMYVSMVGAGEAGGILDTIFHRLFVHIEKDVRLSEAVGSALAYPASVILGLSILFGGILSLVVSAFKRMPKSTQVDLPFLTEVVVGVGGFTADYSIYLVAFLPIAIAAFWFSRKTRKGRRIGDKFLLTLPVFGPILLDACVVRFSRSTATMVASGVPILDCLEIAAHTSRNAITEEAILIVRQSVEEGRTIVEGLDESNVFPAMVTQMIGIGEQSGALEQMLAKIADFYEGELETRVRNLMAILKPAIAIVFGTMACGMAIGIYLGIITLMSH